MVCIGLALSACAIPSTWAAGRMKSLKVGQSFEVDFCAGFLDPASSLFAAAIVLTAEASVFFVRCMSAGRRSCSTSGVHDLPGFASKKRCLSGVSHTCIQLQGNWFSLTACEMTCLILSNISSRSSGSTMTRKFSVASCSCTTFPSLSAVQVPLTY